MLASGNGTALQAIFEAMDAGELPKVQVVKVLSDVADSGALEKARSRGLEAVFCDPQGKQRAEYDAFLMKEIGDSVDYICLIGYMRILGAAFIEHYQGKILNVHPSLLPKFGGKGFYGAKVHEAVLEAGEVESGMTIHLVTEEVDGGPILLQKKVEVSALDTPTSLKSKVQALECEGYPEVLRKLSSREL